jgi:hypothetical protein
VRRFTWVVVRDSISVGSLYLDVWAGAGAQMTGGGKKGMDGWTTLEEAVPECTEDFAAKG